MDPRGGHGKGRSPCGNEYFTINFARFHCSNCEHFRPAGAKPQGATINYDGVMPQSIYYAAHRMSPQMIPTCLHGRALCVSFVHVPEVSVCARPDSGARRCTRGNAPRVRRDPPMRAPRQIGSVKFNVIHFVVQRRASLHVDATPSNVLHKCESAFQRAPRRLCQSEQAKLAAHVLQSFNKLTCLKYTKSATVCTIIVKYGLLKNHSSNNSSRQILANIV